MMYADYKYLSNKIIRTYEIPQLLSERDILIADLQQNNVKNKNLIVGIIILFLVLTIGIVLYFYQLHQKYKKRYDTVRKESEQRKHKNAVVTKQKNNIDVLKSLGVDDHTIQDILKSLEHFEQANQYLKSQLSLNEAAKLLNTNSKYLSKVINAYKEKTFVSYVNDLRIDYIIDKIQHDPAYEKYTIRGIAFEGGFSSIESFLRAFYKKTGLKPSYFIKKVREEQQSTFNSLN
ncbi:MAG: helix-turn-helix domain-containing protein [Bacteroidota bacterium]